MTRQWIRKIDYSMMEVEENGQGGWTGSKRLLECPWKFAREKNKLMCSFFLGSSQELT